MLSAVQRAPSLPPSAPRTAGRYELFDEIASGGMGVVHLARLEGEAGFARLVAAKRLHADLALDTELVRMLTEEARLAARVRHPNVASVLDIVDSADGILLVMEYLEGETLFRLVRASLERGQRVPPEIASAIMTGALLGLHAAHEARSERGEPLNIVHRDVSPQNILVGADGITRVLDFGVAKAASRTTVTARGAARGKLSYMAPEQARGLPLDRRADLFAAGVVLWEMLVGERLFAADDPASTLARLLNEPIVAPSARLPHLPPALDRVVLRALDRVPPARHATAEQMASDLEEACPPATQRQVAAWVMALAGTNLQRWRQRCAEIEAAPRASIVACEPSPTSLRDVPPIEPSTPDPTPLPSPLPLPPTLPEMAAVPSPTRPSLRGRRALQAACLLLGGLPLLAWLSAPPPFVPARAMPTPPSALASAAPREATSALAASSATAPEPPAPRARKGPPGARAASGHR